MLVSPLEKFWRDILQNCKNTYKDTYYMHNKSRVLSQNALALASLGKNFTAKESKGLVSGGIFL